MCNDLPKEVADSGWTHQMLARALGVHHTTVGRAIRKPSRREIMREQIKALIQQPPPHTSGHGEAAE